MKTGKVAKLFNKDTNTITDWSKRFAEFFSPAARATERAQRDYQPEDLIVINTIRVARDVQKVEDWELIRARLTAKDFDTNLPPDAMNIEGNNAVVVYTEYKALEAKNMYLEQEIERLTKKSDNLLMEVGKWRALAELYEQQLKEKGQGK